MESLRIMSFNIRVQSSSDGINSFFGRLDRLSARLMEICPDLVGLQEATFPMREALRASLGSRYVLIGGGRNADCNGEGCPILYRPDRMELLGLRQFWLSDDPDLPGSRYAHSDQSGCPRVALVARFRVNGGGLFTLINTHLDHVGFSARELGFSALASELSQTPAPAALVGDFNCTPSSPELIGFLDRIAPLGWHDCTASLGGTFHGFGRVDPPEKIDYIFSNVTPCRAERIADPPIAGVYLSDHIPLLAEVGI